MTRPPARRGRPPILERDPAMGARADELIEAGLTVDAIHRWLLAEFGAGRAPSRSTIGAYRKAACQAACPSKPRPRSAIGQGPDLRAALDRLAAEYLTIDEVRAQLAGMFGEARTPSRTAIGAHVRRIRRALRMPVRASHIQRDPGLRAVIDALCREPLTIDDIHRRLQGSPEIRKAPSRSSLAEYVARTRPGGRMARSRIGRDPELRVRIEELRREGFTIDALHATLRDEFGPGRLPSRSAVAAHVARMPRP